MDNSTETAVGPKKKLDIRKEVRQNKMACFIIAWSTVCWLSDHLPVDDQFQYHQLRTAAHLPMAIIVFPVFRAISDREILMRVWVPDMAPTVAPAPMGPFAPHLQGATSSNQPDTTVITGVNTSMQVEDESSARRAGA